MKRLAVLPIEHCWNCPFFDAKNDYTIRYVYCSILNRKIIRYAGEDETRRVESILEQWLNCDCKLEKVE